MRVEGRCQYIVKGDKKEKRCHLKDYCFDVKDASVSVWGSNQRFGYFNIASL